MIEEGLGGGGVTRVYVHGARVDEIVASSTHSTSAVLFHHYDALGAEGGSL